MQQLEKLEVIFGWHDDIAKSFGPWVCESGCSDCCTALVSLTTLEADYMMRKGATSARESLQNWPEQSILPRMGMTANERALLCSSGESFEEDAPPPVISACPLLEDGRCSCYEARPLMFRMMLSSKKCNETGHAEMPSMLLSFTTVCQQLVEDIDRQGRSGYLIHMLPLFEDPGFAADYSTEQKQIDTGYLKRNQPNPEFLVPPEDRPQIRLWLQELDERLKQY